MNKNYYKNPRKTLGRRKKINRKKTLFQAFTILILFSGIISLLYIPKFKIKNISFQSDYALNEKIVETVRKELDKKFFLVIPRDNFFTLRKNLIKKIIAENLFQIKSVTLNKDFPDILNISYEEKQKIGVYCSPAMTPARNALRHEASRSSDETEDRPSSEKNEKCFFIDEDGFGSEEINPEEAHALTNGKKITVLQKENISSFKTRDEFLKKEEFAPILKFMENAKTLGLRTEKTVFKNDSLRSYEIYFEEGWHVLLDREALNREETAFQNLKLLLNSEIKDKRKNLEYIDLRFANKAFYKLK